MAGFGLCRLLLAAHVYIFGIEFFRAIAIRDAGSSKHMDGIQRPAASAYIVKPEFRDGTEFLGGQPFLILGILRSNLCKLECVRDVERELMRRSMVLLSVILAGCSAFIDEIPQKPNPAP
jgi:hypothetical protein